MRGSTEGRQLHFGTYIPRMLILGFSSSGHPMSVCCRIVPHKIYYTLSPFSDISNFLRVLILKKLLHHQWTPAFPPSNYYLFITQRKFLTIQGMTIRHISRGPIFRPAIFKVMERVQAQVSLYRTRAGLINLSMTHVMAALVSH
jgi:hypothetical protein